MSPEQRKYWSMASLRQLLDKKDLVSIKRLNDSKSIQASDINFDKIPDPVFKTNLRALFPEGGRRRKSRKTRRRRHGRKTRRSRK